MEHEWEKCDLIHLKSWQNEIQEREKVIENQYEYFGFSVLLWYIPLLSKVWVFIIYK